jgi:hypothetical protein
VPPPIPIIDHFIIAPLGMGALAHVVGYVIARLFGNRRLAPPEGPFRLVVAGEKRHARWVREVTALDIEEAK